MWEVPRAVRSGCALNAWLAGRLDADAAITQVGERCQTVGFVLGGEPLTVALLLGELRRRGVHRVSVSMPVPGDPQGLGGPAAFNVLALEAGEGLLLHGCSLGMVPEGRPDGVLWQVHPADPPSYLPDIAAADRDLRQALRSAADALAELDVASWSPDTADALLDLRSARSDGIDLPLPTPGSAGLVVTALRCRRIVRLGLAADAGAATAKGMGRRRDVLVSLDQAARTALIAVGSATGFAENAAGGLAAG